MPHEMDGLGPACDDCFAPDSTICSSLCMHATASHAKAHPELPPCPQQGASNV
eukprot:CAMPEP_0119113492 /NCGR_PEP_ID=MMETSP1180-20130426/44120_1 /TAXON_ID=3052 ORGANISM="Chlamydomonas cf sp, Strain CCMP681" /NCGR_SAMPLE_ID=MMETSP1180 /ASSEMBLY_ACC=CAM_ASM_000741 /LENGTH=52 /DNA_ID=CAMNT_0007101599 /DNA_START=559 /DNA_END=717 /DNA_ORIENTATION=+